ncbi:MAG TPA: hypothetical protein VF120_09570 [Ktedonobacterales bacterium]
MQKGVVMQVQLYITGDDAPAHDFTQTGHDVALQVLQQGLQHYSGPYAVQVQKMQPVDGGDDDSDEPASGDALDVKPLLSYTPSSQASSAAASATAAGPKATSPAPATAAPQPPMQQHVQPQAQQPAPTEPEEQEEHPKHHFWDR